MLEINGVPAIKFIRAAYDLGENLDGPGRYDMHDEVQQDLRNIKGWIQMAEHDALEGRPKPESGGDEGPQLTEGRL